MLENTLELANNTLGCSSSSIELSPKENLSSSSSTSSRSGSLYNYKSKIKRLRRQNLRKIYLRTKLKKRAGQAKSGYLKANRYASLSSASSTSSSVSTSPNNLLEQAQPEDKQPQTKKPMKLHKFYHSVPFKCPFCFTFKEIPQDFIDHLTSVHFSDVKLLYERKCTKLMESGENEAEEESTAPPNLAEIPSKLAKMIQDLENEEEDQARQEMAPDDQQKDECLNQTKSLDKEQEIHTPPKTPPLENKPESIGSPKSSYLSMNSALLPPRKQQRLLKSPFDAEDSQKIKSFPFSVPALLSDQQQTKTNYMSLNMSGHQAAQVQEASMKCAICDRGFEYYSNLRRHIKTKHKIFGKQVKEYVIRQNGKKCDNDQHLRHFIESSSSSAKTASPVCQNPVLKKPKNEHDESFDDDMDESQAELASSTSTTSSFSTHSSHAANLYANQTNPALMAAAAFSAHFPAHILNQQQMMAFLTHSNTMNKIKSINQFSKLIQNIVEMNHFGQFNNGSVLAAVNQLPKVKSESLDQTEHSVHSKKEEDADLYDEDLVTKKEEIEYEENDAEHENKVDGTDDLDNDNDNDDMRSRTSSSRSFHSDSQSNQLTPPSVTPSKFMFNSPLGNHTHPPPLNQFVLETHLRNLTQQNFGHQAYQAYQQNLHRLNLANQPFLNPSPQQQQQQQQVGGLQQGSSTPQVPGTARRKKSKDFCTSSMVQSMRNLQCSPSSQQNGDQNIRFSSEIWRCPYCCYETTSASRYNSHLVCHGWKPYLCPHC
ncbi:hypothetical protein BpHYR1_013605, partial [Brachionus plicatilis]